MFGHLGRFVKADVLVLLENLAGDLWKCEIPL